MRYLVFFLGFAFLFSCSKDTYFEQNVKFKNESWTYDDVKSFSFEIEDTSAYFDIVLDVKHSPDYSYENVYVKIQTQFPDGSITYDQVSLELADKMDQWQGKCNSRQCVVSIYLQSGVYFKSKGSHTLEIEQFNRSNPLKGIKDMTLRLVQVEK